MNGLETRQDGDVVILIPQGSLIDDDLQKLDSILGEKSGTKVVLDLGRVDYLNSQVISFCIFAARRAQHEGGEVVLVGAHGNVRQALDMVQIDEIVNMKESLEGALEHLRGEMGAPSPLDACLGGAGSLEVDDVPRIFALRKELEDHAERKDALERERLLARSLVQRIDLVIFENVTEKEQILESVKADLELLRSMRAGETGNESSATNKPDVSFVVEPSSAWRDFDPELIKEGVTESLENLHDAEEALLKLDVTPNDMELINRIFRSFHSIKGFSGFVSHAALSHMAHLAETVLDHARDGSIRITGMTADVILETVDVLRRMLDGLASGEEWQETEKDRKVRDFLESHRIGHLPLDHIEPASSDFGTPASSGKSASGAQGMEDKGEESASAREEFITLTAAPPPRRADDVAGSTIRIATVRLDQLVNMVGELVIAQAMVASEEAVAQSLEDNTHLHKNVAMISKITRDLQDISMSLRMVPLAATFQRLARVVRDTARKIGKEIDFVTVGEETEIDRSMVETLVDPLVHMIRNSVDHGIETPDDRVKAGKPRRGEVRLTAEHEGGYVVITLSDDGKGMDPEMLRHKAVEKGLISVATKLSRQEQLNLVFLPGFSTAEIVTDLSGRGVGMDVVKTNIEGMNGDLALDSQLGRGSRVTIRIPLTMAIIEGMLVRVGPITYTIPLLAIRESLAVASDQVTKSADGQEFVRIRESIFPVVRLAELHRIVPMKARLEEGILILLENKGNSFCLFVDEILGQHQNVVKGLSEFLGRVRGVSSCAILGSGEISLILDVTSLYAMAVNRKEAAA